MGKAMVFLAVMAIFSCLAFSWQTDPLTHNQNMLNGLRQVMTGVKEVPNLSITEAKFIYNDLRTAFNFKMDCSKERIMDWDTYCNIIHSQKIELDCVNTNEEAKSSILDNLANSKQSYQYRCLHGGYDY